ncbi:uncharacterized protein TRIADDRAFT_57950 [Trichoplax adhaerens]|uniref:Sodium/calcium exchanger membrane region domain-containing protein n=1 Tax=Trichoplax adhaerens TaxID=10228 RepID=B3S273_TRIAD|nr:hypothetical protein TRIADDRAFT_57950 [Trichoplax adhaerens]EDV23065.1 hypothetical protein TRIADDRAFT_57950 [Trichoplax adhaerens]|eukprot:XP_002113975.1 hypothetical protein TRIADDRAFT_57950 [Trichoplax adhaerens]
MAASRTINSWVFLIIALSFLVQTNIHSSQAAVIFDIDSNVSQPLPTTDNTSGGAGDTCYQMRHSWFPCANNIPGNLILMVFYGTILIMAAKLISDGAELLLDLGLPASIIGGLVLPLLGAIPDAVMILVSGLGPKELAQRKISVGMGALAGSTIMLLTLAWAGSLIIGRCDLGEDGKAIEKTGADKFSLTRQGVTVMSDVKVGVIVMVLTSLSYLVVQTADWVYGPSKVGPQPAYIRYCALATMIISIISCIVNMAYLPSKIGDVERAQDHNTKVAGTSQANEDEESTNEKSRLVPPAAGLSKKYFTAWKVMASAKESQEEKEEEESPKQDENEQKKETDEPKGKDSDEPEDKDKVLKKSIAMLLGGLLLVTFFSDPMCNAVVALTNPYNENYIPISAFYISFVVNPICSNASELISSLQFAAKRKRLNITVTYSQLYGAATMNNTLCLAVFTGLVFFRGLQWESSAEVLVILIVVWFVAIFGYRETYKVWMGFPIAVMYIFSIVLVAILQSPLVGWK